MTYNLTMMYDGGAIGYFHGVNINSNNLLIDVLIVVFFVVIYTVLATRQYSSKNSLLMTSFLIFVLLAALVFGLGASGVISSSDMAPYVTRMIVMFAITIASLIWNVLN